MSEIAKLQLRLQHVSKNVKEYRMTVAEAKTLLNEIEELQTQLQEKPQIEVVLNEPAVITRIMDGGAF